MALSSNVGSGRDRSRRDFSAPWRHVDPILLVCTGAVSCLGLLMVFSATRGPTDPPVMTDLVKQAGFMVVGSVALVVTASIDYRKYRDWIVPLYLATMFVLGLVVSPLGLKTRGAQSWFGVAGFQIQPSEISKVVMVLTLASLLASWRGDIDLRRLVMALIVAGIPMALIMRQPDLGTALVFIAISVVMFLIGGVSGRHLAVLAVIGLIGVIGILTSNVLGQYQKDRLTVFLDSSTKLAGPAYNVNQSQAAIANGGVTGSGLFQGPQTRLRYVPEQQTDFIFTALGEQLGLAGGATLLGMFVVMIWRMWRTAQLARDMLGTLISVGVMAMFVFQIFQSVGMTMGIMPVTGIPLPFMSYGGSSTVTSFVAIGLVLNVHMRRFR